jgi:hypothetical protein
MAKKRAKDGVGQLRLDLEFKPRERVTRAGEQTSKQPPKDPVTGIRPQSYEKVDVILRETQEAAGGTPILSDDPAEVRQEFIRLRQKLDAAIQRRDEIKRRREALSPKVWRLARNRKPNLRNIISEIAEIKRQLAALVRQHGETPGEAAARCLSTIAGDPLHLQRPVVHSKLYGHGVRLGEDED